MVWRIKTYLMHASGPIYVSATIAAANFTSEIKLSPTILEIKF